MGPWTVRPKPNYLSKRDVHLLLCCILSPRNSTYKICLQLFWEFGLVHVTKGWAIWCIFIFHQTYLDLPNWCQQIIFRRITKMFTTNILFDCSKRNKRNWQTLRDISRHWKNLWIYTKYYYHFTKYENMPSDGPGFSTTRRQL